MDKKNTTKIIAGTVLIIAVIIGWLAWLGSEPRTGEIGSAPENWQTYRNDEYGFEVSYPKDWHVYEQADEDRRIYIQTVQGEVSQETAPEDFKRIWIAYFSDEGTENPYNLTGSQKYTATNNGISMNYYEWPPDAINGESTMEAYWINGNGDKFKADCASEVGADNSKQEVGMLKKILSTFKFTNSHGEENH